MVQTIGIALGNSNCYVAACKDGGVEILLNDYSQRSTPAMVAFGENGRLIGVDASLNQMMNLKNTIYDLMKLLGKPYQEIAKLDLPFRIEQTLDGQGGVVVTHMREEKHFSFVQVLAMLLSKLRDVSGAVDCVINCPQFYNEAQQIAVYQAASIAGLNPLHVIPDMSAVALYYGYYRTNRDDVVPKVLGFVNFGQSCFQTMIALISPKEDVIKVLSADSEPDIGGRDLDMLLANYFISSQKLELSSKSKLRLLNECEKLKKQLSASSNEMPIGIECLVSEDKDFNARIDRATFESLAQPLFKKLGDCLKRTLEMAQERYKEEIKLSKQSKSKKASKAKTPEKLPPQPESTQEPKNQNESESTFNGADGFAPSDSEPRPDVESQLASSQDVPFPASPAPKSNVDSSESSTSFKIHAVEVVGGSSRIPAFKKLVRDLFGMDASTTLNTDEAVARGCVLHCATLHPGVKVKREIKFKESKPINIDPKAVKVGKDLRETELNLLEYDRQWKSRMDARNNLEEFIFACRSKDQFLEEVNNLEEWLDEEGDNASKEDFLVRLQQLKAHEETLCGKDKSGDTVNQEEQPDPEVDKMSCDGESAESQPEKMENEEPTQE